MATKKDLLVELVTLEDLVKSFITSVPPPEDAIELRGDLEDLEKTVDAMTTNEDLENAITKTKALQTKVTRKTPSGR